MDMSQRASWDWKEVCGKSIPQLEQGSKRACGVEVGSPMEGQAHHHSGAAAFWALGKSGGQGSLEKGRGLVPGKTKSEVEMTLLRKAAVTSPCPDIFRTATPRTTTKGIPTGRN